MTTKATHASQGHSRTSNTTSRFRGRAALGAGLTALLLATSMSASAVTDGSGCTTADGGNCTTGLFKKSFRNKYGVGAPSYFLGTYQLKSEAGRNVGAAFSCTGSCPVEVFTSQQSGNLKLFVNGRDSNIGTLVVVRRL